MIRHVVTFKFNAAASDDREASISSLRGVLEPLASSVPGVQSLEVGVDNRSVDGHWDAVLISHHDSYDALAEYQVHPEHLKALQTVGSLIDGKTVVDYEVGK